MEHVWGLICALSQGRSKASTRQFADPGRVSLPAQQFNPLKHPRSKKAQHKTSIKIMCNVFRYTLSPGRGAPGYKQTTWTEHVPGQG